MSVERSGERKRRLAKKERGKTGDEVGGRKETNLMKRRKLEWKCICNANTRWTSPGGPKNEKPRNSRERNRPFHHSRLIRFQILRRLRITSPGRRPRAAILPGKNPDFVLLITSGTRLRVSGIVKPRARLESLLNEIRILGVRSEFCGGTEVRVSGDDFWRGKQK